LFRDIKLENLLLVQADESSIHQLLPDTTDPHSATPFTSVCSGISANPAATAATGVVVGCPVVKIIDFGFSTLLPPGRWVEGF